MLLLRLSYLNIFIIIRISCFNLKQSFMNVRYRFEPLASNKHDSYRSRSTYFQEKFLSLDVNSLLDGYVQKNSWIQMNNVVMAFRKFRKLCLTMLLVFTVTLFGMSNQVYAQNSGGRMSGSTIHSKAHGNSHSKRDSHTSHKSATSLGRKSDSHTSFKSEMSGGSPHSSRTFSSGTDAKWNIANKNGMEFSMTGVTSSTYQREETIDPVTFRRFLTHCSNIGLVFCLILLIMPYVKLPSISMTGVGSVSYHQIQLAYLLSRQELIDITNNLETIQTRYTLSSGSTSDKEPFCLAKLVEDVAVTNLRVRKSLVAYHIVSSRARDTSKCRSKILDKMNQKSMEERSKFFLDTSTSKASALTVASYLSNPKAPEPSISYLVITILITAVGPAVPCKELLQTSSSTIDESFLAPVYWIKKFIQPKRNIILSRSDIDKIMYNLPIYLKSIATLQAEQRRRPNYDNSGDTSEAGFEVDIIWSPATGITETLTDVELKMSWPELEFI